MCWSLREVTLLRLPVISRLLYFLTKAGSLAGALGIEPKLTESKSVVLPLHKSPTKPQIFKDHFGTMAIKQKTPRFSSSGFW